MSLAVGGIRNKVKAVADKHSSGVRPSGKLSQATPATSDIADKFIKIRQYLYTKSVGSGQYGSVFKCKNTENKQDYALKAFKKSNITNPLTADNPLVRAMLRFDHPNIVKVNEVINDQNSDSVYIVMEYLSGRYGRSLDYQLQKASRGYSEITALYYFRQLCEALQYCHETHRVAHCEVKPENLILSHNDQVVLCDFRISQMFKVNRGATQKAQGSIRFTPPERLGLS